MKKVTLVLLSSLIGGIVAFTLPKIFNQKPDVQQVEYVSPLSDNANHFTRSSANYANMAENVDFTDAAGKTVNTVVHIQTQLRRQSTFYDDFFYFFSNPYYRGNDTYSAFGSGVIISEDGYIITNNHVVQDAESVKVTLNDKRVFPAKVIGTDPSSDLALIKIEASDLHAIVFGNSDDVRIGQWVLAVGNPFNLTSTVTAGIVSAKARNINILGENSSDSPIESFIQTDAAVNPGNSGGALVNTNGELIGINTAIKSNTGNFTGYSFAIPSNIVRKIAADLKQYGIVQRAYLGVQVAEMNEKLADSKGTSINGVYIAKVVPDGAAAKAGLKDGDVILEINKKRINSYPEMIEEVAQYSPGERIEVTYERDKKELKTNIILLNRTGSTNILKPDDIYSSEMHGAKFATLSVSDLKKMRLKHGVAVEEVGDSELARIGIKNGFIITSIDDKPIKKVEDINYLKSKKGKIIIEGTYPGHWKTYYYVLVL